MSDITEAFTKLGECVNTLADTVQLLTRAVQHLDTRLRKLEPPEEPQQAVRPRPRLVETGEGNDPRD